MLESSEACEQVIKEWLLHEFTQAHQQHFNQSENDLLAGHDHAFLKNVSNLHNARTWLCNTSQPYALSSAIKQVMLNL